MEETITRLFFVVDSINRNEEIFETLEEAEEYFTSIDVDPNEKPRLYVAFVKNAYIERRPAVFTPCGIQKWNYHDESDTFEIIKQLK